LVLVVLLLSANASSVASAVAPTSMTAMAATINMDIAFILRAKRKYCLSELSTIRLPFKSDIFSVRTIA
jgi:hypothetical protein